MTLSHLPAVMQIQAECYPAAMQEARALIAARLHASPGQCWIAVDDQGPCGYLFAYLSKRGLVTPLDGDFQPQPDPDCLYLHDLAVAVRANGRRIGQQLVACALAQPLTQSLSWSALVSVQDSTLFWERLGYRHGEPVDSRQALHLASYPAPARYMERALG